MSMDDQTHANVAKHLLSSALGLLCSGLSHQEYVPVKLARLSDTI